jgi:hypothetical protein
MLTEWVRSLNFISLTRAMSDIGHLILCTPLVSDDQNAIPVRLVPLSMLFLEDTAIATDYYQLCVDLS